jgi:phage-related protein (TIGR01555 family)
MSKSSRNVASAANALALTRKPIGASDAQMRRDLKTHHASDGLRNVIAGLGTSRDKTSYSNFFGVARPLTRYEIENMWESCWQCARIVSAPASDMTREWRSFNFADDPKSPSIEMLKQAEKALQVRAKFEEGETWGGLYGGAIMVLGIKGVTDLSQPLIKENVKKGDLVYLQVLDRWRCSGIGTVTDPTSWAFGAPEFYQLAESSVMVHHTRCIRFDGDKLPYFRWLANSRWHASKLQKPYDALIALLQTSGSIATMVMEANIDVIKRDNLNEDMASDENEAKFIKRYALAALLKGNNRMLLLDGTETYDRKQFNFANLDKIQEKVEDTWCGASEMPRTRMYGASPGGLGSNGDGELRNWYDKIRSEQITKQSPRVDYFDEIFVRSALGTFPTDYAYEWNPLWQMSDADQATIDFQNAQRDQIYMQNDVVHAGVVAGSLLTRGTYGGALTPEDVDMATELAKEPEPAPVVVAPPIAEKPAELGEQGGVKQPAPSATAPVTK